MRSRLEMKAWFVWAVMASCASSPDAEREVVRAVPASSVATVRSLPALSRVRVEPKTLRSGAECAVRFSCESAATTRVDVFDDRGFVVRSLDLGDLEPGDHEATWDGRSDTGAPVPSGVYRYAIVAQSPAGIAIHEPSDTTGGEEILPLEFTFERASGLLHWIMPRAGRARLRAGITDYPHLVTLLDWTPLEAGPHSVVWDGFDASGLVHFVDHPDQVILLSLYALPDNTILVDDGRPGTRRVAECAADEPAYPPITKAAPAYFHAQHDPTSCHEVEFDVELLGVSRRDEQNLPIVSGTVLLRVVLDPEDARSLVDQKFEVAFYEDLVFLTEEEDALTPFTFAWDTRRLTPGVHVLTVDVIGYADHLGVRSIQVRVESGP